MDLDREGCKCKCYLLSRYSPLTIWHKQSDTWFPTLAHCFFPCALIFASHTYHGARPWRLSRLKAIPSFRLSLRLADSNQKRLANPAYPDPACDNGPSAICLIICCMCICWFCNAAWAACSDAWLYSDAWPCCEWLFQAGLRYSCCRIIFTAARTAPVVPITRITACEVTGWRLRWCLSAPRMEIRENVWLWPCYNQMQ